MQTHKRKHERHRGSGCWARGAGLRDEMSTDCDRRCDAKASEQNIPGNHTQLGIEEKRQRSHPRCCVIDVHAKRGSEHPRTSTSTKPKKPHEGAIPEFHRRVLRAGLIVVCTQIHTARAAEEVRTEPRRGRPALKSGHTQPGRAYRAPEAHEPATNAMPAAPSFPAPKHSPPFSCRPSLLSFPVVWPADPL